MKFLKSIFFLSVMILSNQLFALTRMPDQALIEIIKEGSVLVTLKDVSSIEGEYPNKSVLQFGSYMPRITFNGTSGKKLTLRAGTSFTLGEMEWGIYNAESGDTYKTTKEIKLFTSSSAINSYTPTANFFIYLNEKIKTIGDLRKATDNKIDFYYGEGQDGEIIL